MSTLIEQGIEEDVEIRTTLGRETEESHGRSEEIIEARRRNRATMRSHVFRFPEPAFPPTQLARNLPLARWNSTRQLPSLRKPTAERLHPLVGLSGIVVAKAFLDVLGIPDSSAFESSYFTGCGRSLNSIPVDTQSLRVQGVALEKYRADLLSCGNWLLANSLPSTRCLGESHNPHLEQERTDKDVRDWGSRVDSKVKEAVEGVLKSLGIAECAVTQRNLENTPYLSDLSRH